MANQVISSAAMRAWEGYWMERRADELLLIEIAATGVTAHLAELGVSGHLVCVCGVGNNGGDGFAVARQWQVSGGQATIVFVGHPDKLKPAARQHMDVALAMGVPLVAVRSKEDVAALPPLLATADCILDALFGIGLDRDVEGMYAAVIEAVNRTKALRVAVDLPSGIQADRGNVLGAAVKADHTVTFQFPKPGHLLMPGRKYAGKLYVHPVAVRTDIIGCPSWRVLGAHDLPDMLPRRENDAHKGKSGRVYLVAGSVGMAGAGVLCARSAMRCGAGLVTFFADPQLMPVYQQTVPQAMFQPLIEGRPMFDSAARRPVTVIGPGRGASTQTLARTLEVLSDEKARAVVDADSLNVLSGLATIPPVKAQLILTPHVGEMARLAHTTMEEVARDPVAVASQCAAAWNAVVVSKSATTVIAAPDGRITFNIAGSPAMAKGGSGDMLCGAIAALWGQGLDAYDAASLGCLLMGLAGEHAAARLGVYSVLAEDILSSLSAVLKGEEQPQR